MWVSYKPQSFLESSNNKFGTNLGLPSRTEDPQDLVNKHIRLLHQYNEIRDVAQGLAGIIAEQRGVRVVDVYKDLGINEGD